MLCELGENYNQSFNLTYRCLKVFTNILTASQLTQLTRKYSSHGTDRTSDFLIIRVSDRIIERQV